MSGILKIGGGLLFLFGLGNAVVAHDDRTLFRWGLVTIAGLLLYAFGEFD